jgi:2,4-dienoyl-CoA reductase-like NADH-dependent reductase (Old Yellow Enzyme family)
VIFDAVRTAFPQEKPVGMKLSGTDWVGGGWHQKQSITLAVELKRYVPIGLRVPQAASQRFKRL